MNKLYPPFEVWQRYHLFMGENYYPQGGWGDWKGSYELLKDLKKDLDEELSAQGEFSDFFWWHILDITKMEVVADQNDFSGDLDKLIKEEDGT